MFTNLFPFSRRVSPAYESRFVEEVRVSQAPPRNRRIERLFIICWILIAIKSAFIFWAVHHYRIPFSGLWVVAPTVIFAALVTYVYWRR
jgi:hypothetical protein